MITKLPNFHNLSSSQGMGPRCRGGLVGGVVLCRRRGAFLCSEYNPACAVCDRCWSRVAIVFDSKKDRKEEDRKTKIGTKD